MSSGRRRFMTQAGTVVATAIAIVTSPHVVAQPKVRWRMPTASEPALDRHRGVAERLTKLVGDTSGGRFQIEVLPCVQILEPFDCFVAEEIMAKKVHAHPTRSSRRWSARGTTWPKAPNQLVAG